MGSGESPQIGGRGGSTPAPSPPVSVVGRYEIYGKIAAGGMATVHFGRLQGGAGFARTVAIKRLHPHLAEDPAFCASLIDEARLVARIHHPHVVPTLDVVMEEGELLLVMEYVRGESLAQAMYAQVARGEPMPLPIASAIAVGALYGLHAAHEATSDQGTALGIVHRDVSPQNILVGVDGLARVIDFGVAKAAGRLQTTRDGVVKGKFAYMAPEQLAGRKLSRATDLYAMGVVLWEMLASRRLFHGEDEAALFGALMAGAKDPPSVHAPGLPPELDAFVMRALAPEPGDRFANAREMAETLSRIVPPALAADVGSWCADVARDSLAKRAAVVSAIESSGGGPLPAREPSSPSATERVRSAAAAIDPVPSARPEAEPGAVPLLASEPAGLSLATPPPASAASGSRSRVVIMVAGASLVVATIGAVWWGPRHRPPPLADTASASAPIVPEVEPSPVETPPPAPPSPPPASSASSIAPAPPSASASASAPAATARPAVTIAPSPRPAAKGCNPPYEFDRQNRKVWKRQCF